MCWSIVDYHEQRQVIKNIFTTSPALTCQGYITLSSIKLIVFSIKILHIFKIFYKSEWVSTLPWLIISLVCAEYFTLWCLLMCSVEEENNHFLFQTYHFIRHLETNITIQHIWRGYWWCWWWPRVCWRMPVHWCWPGEPPVPGDSHRILGIQIFLPSTH